jgi:hypothetical protein
MGKFTKSFSEGMDLFTEITRLGDNKYPLLINGRARFGKITPINKPRKLSAGLPVAGSANFQGLFSAGNFAIVVANGQAFLRDFSDSINENFLALPRFQLNAGAEEVYMELVPASTINYYRQLAGTDVNSALELATTISNTPSAAIFTDNVSQPWIILSDGSTRQTQNYLEWNKDANREYVPIGGPMIWDDTDGKLYILSQDGREVYQSVSGRPLDFMIAITQTGDKVAPDELTGGAGVVSHKVSYSKITALGRVPTTVEGGFFASTLYQGFIVIPDWSETTYGEPRQFSNHYATSTGARDNNSFLGDVNGDTCFIDQTSIRSFNAILHVRNEGRNAPFSLAVSPLFENIIQEYTACSMFDNYAVFAVKTRYGNAFLWYDTLRQCWDSMDMFPEISSPVRKIIEIKTDTNVRKLLFLTVAGDVYEYFGDTEEVATCKLYIGDFCSGDAKIEQKLGTVNAIMENTQTTGTIYASLFVDGKFVKKLAKPIAQNTTNVPTGTISVPFGDSSSDSVRNVLFDFNRAFTGWRFGIMFEWSFKSTLTHFVAESDDVKLKGNTMQSQMSEYDANKQFLESLPGGRAV